MNPCANRFTQSFRVDIPIVQAPMGYIDKPALQAPQLIGATRQASDRVLSPRRRSRSSDTVGGWC